MKASPLMQCYQQCHTPVDKCNAIKVKYQKLIKTLINDF